MTHPYGLITSKDAETLEHTLTLVCMSFPAGDIKTCELGLHKGRTAKGIHHYITHIRGRGHKHTAVDNCKDLKVELPFPGCFLLIGTTAAMAELVPNESQHMLFIDADHSFSATITDFSMYCNKLVKGGYLIFHDTSPLIPAFKDYQSGDRDDPNSYIACRKAVDYLGLLESTQWAVIFDEYDSTSDYGGMITLKKLY